MSSKSDGTRDGVHACTSCFLDGFRIRDPATRASQKLVTGPKRKVDCGTDFGYGHGVGFISGRLSTPIEPSLTRRQYLVALYARSLGSGTSKQ